MGMFENSEIAAVRRQNEQKTGGFSAENGRHRHQTLPHSANLHGGHWSTQDLQFAIFSVLPCRRTLLGAIIDAPSDVIAAALDRLVKEGAAGIRACAVTGAEFICDRRRSEHLTSRGNSSPRSVEEKKRIAFLFRRRR